jgi:hypothetical protein
MNNKRAYSLPEPIKVECLLSRQFKLSRFALSLANIQWIICSEEQLEKTCPYTLRKIFSGHSITENNCISLISVEMQHYIHHEVLFRTRNTPKRVYLKSYLFFTLC